MRTILDDEIRKKLAEKLDVKNLEELKRKKLTDALNSINETIRHACRVDRSISIELFPDINPEIVEEETFLCRRSLSRYIKDGKVDKTKLKGIEFYIHGKVDKRGKHKFRHQEPLSFFQGRWKSYVYDTNKRDSGKVMETYLSFTDKGHPDTLYVEYYGIIGRFEGSAKILQNSLIITLNHLYIKIEIFLCAEIPPNLETTSEVILNVYCLANSPQGPAVVSNVLFVKNTPSEND